VYDVWGEVRTVRRMTHNQEPSPTGELKKFPEGSLLDDLQASVPLQDTFGDSVNVVSMTAAIDHVRGRYVHSYSDSSSGTLSLDDAVGAFADAVVERSSVDSGGKRFSVALRLSDGLVSVASSYGGGMNFTALANSFERARELVNTLIKMVPERVVAEDTVPIAFFYGSSSGPERRNREITAPGFEEIEENYTAAAKRAFLELTGVEKPAGSGRLLLLHGPPGTGKTTAIRMLARSWKSWCDVAYVMDPEALLNNMEYLQSLVLEDVGQEGRWTLYVIEDADEIIGADAKARTGQALSRLLNVTDGIVGQGLNALFLITTNEPVARLHEAVTRPGRCLADIHVDRLSVKEANEWLAAKGSAATVRQPSTLAELFEILTPTTTNAEAVYEPQGQYL